MFDTIIAPAALHELLASDAEVRVFDCEFDLADPSKGLETFLAGHIPGARHLDLDTALSGKATGTNGRHPLPTREVFAERMRRLGVHDRQQVVAYDGSGGAAAARLWWMLRWCGHREVAVLDGGRSAWVAAGFALESGEPEPARDGDFALKPSLVADPVSAADVLASLGDGSRVIIDARDPARFRGESAALDPVSGHIPGARNRFFRDNLGEDGLFRDAGALARDFKAILGDTSPADAIVQCGSGVTACHNALAMEIAGLSGARLYPGSWSEWIADPARPVETGSEKPHD
ncbi:MAG: sulfurtransferase [Novosphingobium sp.]|nr:sulfurtransferase [Novosphingobium sp.]